MKNSKFENQFAAKINKPTNTTTQLQTDVLNYQMSMFAHTDTHTQMRAAGKNLKMKANKYIYIHMYILQGEPYFASLT